MPTLVEKRAALHASLEQLVGQVNRHSGAIAVLDELIAEEAAQELLPPLAFDTEAETLASAPFEFPPVAPPIAPEMLPVVRGTGDDSEEPISVEIEA
jgi:hypothetical protein